MNMIKYTCDACGQWFKRLSNMEEPSTRPCTYCKTGTMHVEEE
jgi:DNA-directed RNA polymerase subunit RPC12/RpoP